ncbi:MAG: hypothetical protein AAFZ15_29120 [Bacteroidota bacterium]
MKCKNTFLAFSFLLLTAFGWQLDAQTPGNAYVAQANDWLSKMSQAAYGNPHLYHKIIEGTNEKALSDNSYKTITSANKITAGQKFWIPGSGRIANKNTSGDDAQLVAIPKTNCEIRVWYNYQVVAISVLNKKWIADGLDLETRARKAYELRHAARVNARFMMQDKSEVEGLQTRDMNKYGNPDGPTFDYLLKKNTDKGMSVEEGYQSILDSSSRVSPVYNSECQ